MVVVVVTAVVVVVVVVVETDRIEACFRAVALDREYRRRPFGDGLLEGSVKSRVEMQSYN